MGTARLRQTVFTPTSVASIQARIPNSDLPMRCALSRMHRHRYISFYKGSLTRIEITKELAGRSCVARVLYPWHVTSKITIRPWTFRLNLASMLNPEMAAKGLMFSEARYAVLLERNIFISLSLTVIYHL